MKPILTGLLVMIIQWQGYSQSCAREAAETFLRNRIACSEAGFTQVQQYGNVWIFENPELPAFVIVKEEPGFPVIGYSIENSFTRYGNVPAPAAVFLEALKNHPASKLLFSTGLKTGMPRIDPLVRTQWGQDDFFNFYCPKDLSGPGGRTYAGCIAVALGQIVRYYGKFNSFFFSCEIETNKYGPLSATIGNYQWSAMENQPLAIDKEISRFLLGMGIISMMDYGPGLSIATNSGAYDAFKKLKYLSASRLTTGDTDPAYTLQLVSENLRQYQPVYVSGSGHAFVCDGFDSTGLFHFNLGWGGYADGYYPFDMLGMIQIDNYITGLAPFSRIKAPVNLRLEMAGGQLRIAWSNPVNLQELPRFYRVYTDDDQYLETTNLFMPVDQLPPGRHLVKVSSVTSQGESRWIGPVAVKVDGQSLEIKDPSLRHAILREMNNFPLQTVESEILSGSIPSIMKLEITGTCTTLDGIENCSGLQSLSIRLNEPQVLDLAPVYLLKRLKKIDLLNVIPTSSLGFEGLIGLVTLQIDGVAADSLIVFDNLNGLVELEVANTHFQSFGRISLMPDLHVLKVSNTGIENLGFAANLLNLGILEASDNRITQLDWSQTLPNLASLSLRGNQLNNCDFLIFTPSIETLNLEDNRISSFRTSVPLARLTQLDISGNQMTEITLEKKLLSLVNLDASQNQLRSVKELCGTLPAIQSFDLHNNRLNWWHGSFENLKWLDLSHNKIAFPDNLTANPNLIHLNLAYNAISDLEALNSELFIRESAYINLTGNPISEESYSTYIPAFLNKTDTLLLPGSSQPLSPCYLEPAHGAIITETGTSLSWSSAPLPDNSWFEIFAGPDPLEQKMVLSGITSTHASLGLAPGKRYFWTVMTVTPDTSFQSGYSSFNTFSPVSLPYVEDFESYESFGFLTDLSPWWISGSLSLNTGRDGRIERNRKYEGRQSVKIDNFTDLVLPLENITTTDLQIQQYLFIDEFRSGCVRMNGIAGSNLAAYFKTNGKVDIFYDEFRQGEFDYPKGKWFQFQVRFIPAKKYLSIRIDGKTVLSIPKTFPAGQLVIKELRYSWENSPLQPSGGYPIFYVDKLEIGSLSTGAEVLDTPLNEIRVYPNPAVERLWVSFAQQVEEAFISIIDQNGRLLSRIKVFGLSGETGLDIRNLDSGIYFIRLESSGRSIFTKFLVCR